MTRPWILCRHLQTLDNLTYKKLLVKVSPLAPWRNSTPTLFVSQSRCRSSNFRPSAANAQPRRTRRIWPAFTLIGLILGGAGYYLFAPDRKNTVLNRQTFAPYTVTSREVISPTSVILTVQPQDTSQPPPYLKPGTSEWRYPLWSVEFKQPEVQIARHYTPLPPLEGEQAADGRLRFYVRAVGGGEMSNYLSRLGEGQEVWLRGPHKGFDVLQRLGSQKHVTFLAGGTGLVPAMQVARAVLDADHQARMTILWAVRKREEAQGHPPAAASWWPSWTGRALRELRADVADPSPIAEHLKQMKAKYAERLEIRIAVDEEGTSFGAKDIAKTLLTPTPDTAPQLSSIGCLHHDQQSHERLSELESALPICTCDAVLGAKPGRNLFMVSGPDGFVSHYAGRKVWFGGTLSQGPVGGVIGKLRSNYPSLAQDWLVLKL